MYSLLRTTLLTAVIVLMTAHSALANARADEDRPLVQIALLLDTSNSMDGLIDQAKSQLWRIVNEVARSRYEGAHPRLEVALYEYGNNRLQARQRWIRQVLAFNTDLDAISEALFGLRTSGGEEYCGAVINRSLQELDWSRKGSSLKLVYIAGNEPFTQGPTPYRHALRKAHRNDVIVNTIFCGDSEDGRRGSWMKAAQIADGSYAVINQDRHVAHIPAPQDEEIGRLGGALNQTYIGYGSSGNLSMKRQKRQDKAAHSIKQGASIARAVAKSGSAYKNSGWDLVDAMEDGEVDLGAISIPDLPAAMVGMSSVQKNTFVKGKSEERKKLQAKILQLNKEREKHIAKKKKEIQKKEKEKGIKTLDQALIEALHTSGKSRGFTFE